MSLGGIFNDRMHVLTSRSTVHAAHGHGIAIITLQFTEMATIEHRQEQEIKDLSTIEATTGEKTHH